MEDFIPPVPVPTKLLAVDDSLQALKKTKTRKERKLKEKQPKPLKEPKIPKQLKNKAPLSRKEAIIASANLRNDLSLDALASSGSGDGVGKKRRRPKLVRNEDVDIPQEGEEGVDSHAPVLTKVNEFYRLTPAGEGLVAALNTMILEKTISQQGAQTILANFDACYIAAVTEQGRELKKSSNVRALAEVEGDLLNYNIFGPMWKIDAENVTLNTGHHIERLDKVRLMFTLPTF